ncbi:MAG: TlpA disulfide reductase family protein [Pseudomonadota bacterium]
MSRLLSALLLAAFTLGANPALADLATAAGLREGDMKKLVFHDSPEPSGKAAFDLPEGGGTKTLEAYQGNWVLLNFWATWCAPCRHEMPMLSELQSTLGGNGFEVVTIASGRNSPAGIVRFFDEIGVDNLTRYQDPNMRLSAEMGIFGLPITVILDPAGNEVARLRGDADWSSDSAKAIIAALMAPPS